MRGLWKAAWLAVPLVAAAAWNEDEKDSPSTTFDVAIPQLTESPDESTILNFRLDVYASEQVCGYGNVTVNDQELAQVSEGTKSEGSGVVLIGGGMVEASWTFHCLDDLPEPFTQLLGFTIRSFEGTSVDGVTLWVMFNQAHGPLTISSPSDGGSSTYKILSPLIDDDEILVEDAMSDVEDDAVVDVVEDMKEEDVTAFDNFEYDNTAAEDYNVEAELQQIEWMKAQVQDLIYQIYEKEETVALYVSQTTSQKFEDCDSLKCVIKTIYREARHKFHRVVSKIYSKLAGHEQEEPEEDGFPPFHKHPHHRRPHHGKRPHWRRPPFRHHPPHHGNQSHHNHTCHGNHTHHRPPPPPPFCHCPPPPHHRKPPHRKLHPGPPRYPTGMRPHGLPAFTQDNLPPPIGHEPQHPHPMGSSPPSPPSLPSLESNLPTPSTQPGHAPPSPSLGGEGPPSWVHHHIMHRIKKAIALIATGGLLFLFITAIHRTSGCCSSTRRQERRARREERRRRREYRRAAHRQAWRSWLARHFCRRSESEREAEEKEATLDRFGNNSDDSDVVASEIGELRNAFDVVSDLIAAEEGRVSMDSHASLPEYMSEQGEALPTYEDNDGSEMSSIIADGFMYTPGSTPQYTPGHSSTGSLDSVLGDVKE